MTTRTLDKLISQWRSFKSSAAQTSADWIRIESGAVKFDSERRKQTEANALLRCARRYDELLTRIGSRFIAISLMSTEVMKKAKVPLQQREDRVREAIVNMRMSINASELRLRTKSEHITNFGVNFKTSRDSSIRSGDRPMKCRVTSNAEIVLNTTRGQHRIQSSRKIS
ncbi:hypothetical protein Q1695_010211 [Nippostrongylus brasiliensis]|nr:hypothetical protein Q1695_010211 [Nippostrongylus brasiliensis]